MYDKIINEKQNNRWKGFILNKEIFELEQIVAPLLEWYDHHARILPWREEPTAYHVWISEIMLQQTRVEAVKPYYERFLRVFPDVKTLSEANEELLLKTWEGLGYYNRVRNLHKAAQMIMNEYAGEIPDTYEELLRLPGIGSYTAGAVSSIAFGRSVSAVDGNVLRIVARVRMDDEDILDAKVKKRIETELNQIMPEERPGDFNQAMMELGAMICIPNGEAKCQECPWHCFCQAKKYDRIQEFPKKKKKKARVIEEKTILVIQDAEKAALRKRPSKGLLAGMYEFPWLEGNKTSDEVLDYLKEAGFQVIHIKELEHSKHIFTHKEWHMVGYAVRVDELEPNKLLEQDSSLLFLEPENTEQNYPIPTAFSAYTKYLKIRIGNDKYAEP